MLEQIEKLIAAGELATARELCTPQFTLSPNLRVEPDQFDNALECFQRATTPPLPARAAGLLIKFRPNSAFLYGHFYGLRSMLLRAEYQFTP